MGLSREGQAALQTFMQGTAETYGLSGTADLANEFNVSVEIEQELEKKVSEKSTFWQAITVRPVDELSGEVIRMSASGFIGKRTNTKANHDRHAIDPHNLEAQRYFCHEGEYDRQIEWNTIDSWAKFGKKKFYQMWSDLGSTQIVLNRIMTGFWGQKEALETSNAGYSPDGATIYDMGQDFHKGWLQTLIEVNPKNVIGLSPDGIVPIYLGAGATKKAEEDRAEGKVAYGFENLDALVFTLRQKLPRAYRDNPDNRVLIGSQLYNDEVLRLYNSNGDEAVQKKPLDMYLAKHQFAKTPVLDVPYFPESGILFTRPKNLAYYYQSGKGRRSIEQNKHRKCVEDFWHIREDFTVEDPEQAIMTHPDAIHIPDGKGGWKAATGDNKWAIA